MSLEVDEERDEDIVALGRLLSYAQLEAKRLDLGDTEDSVRAALSALRDEAPDALSGAAPRAKVRIDHG